MTGPRPDDLAAARAADQLNAWLDRHRSGAIPRPGEPPLAPTVREAARLAAIPVADAAVRAEEDRFWEDLMLRHAMTAPSTDSVSASVAVLPPSDTRWQPRTERPADRSIRADHRFGHRVMGMVATLTIVALIGLSGLAVYLNAPRDPAPPTSLAAVGATSPTTDGQSVATPTVASTPVRADATTNTGAGNIWTLPDSTFDELPAAESFGDGWHPLPSVFLSQQPGTSFQIETRYYANNSGSRLRIMLVRYVDDFQFDEAFDYLAEEIQRYQQTMSFHDEPARTERLESPLDGCSRVVRAEGTEWVTSFPVSATLCQSSDERFVMLISVNGHLDLAEDLLEPHAADVVVTEALDFIGSEATPVAAP